MTGRMTHPEADRAEFQLLAIRQDHVGQRLRPDLQAEHQGLLRSSPVQVEISGMEIDGAGVTVHQAADGSHVIQVRVREEDRLGRRAPGFQRTGDPLGIGTRVDDHHASVRTAGADQVAIRLEGADGEGEDLEAADVLGDVQTEKEVPQPQEPVAFGFSNVKPEPLKLLW